MLGGNISAFCVCAASFAFFAFSASILSRSSSPSSSSSGPEPFPFVLLLFIGSNDLLACFFYLVEWKKKHDCELSKKKGELNTYVKTT
jgi:hypothetical protein